MTDALNESTSEAPTTRFDVFISYSHADAKIAERLSRRIRRYKTPAAIDRTTKRLRVFRDVERLTAHPQLGEALAERLEQADNLLVLCSPAAVASEYVETEIQTFIEQKGPDAVTLTVVDGTPAESFPGAIKANYEEPLYVDLRPAGGFFKSWRTFRDESLRIVAALLGVDYAELNREDERRRRRLRWTTAFVSLITVFGLGAVYVADTVSAEVWREIRLPTRYYDSSLLPVEDYAVYIQDPDVRLFRGDGAEFAAQFPPFPIALHGNNGRDFVQQTETYLRSEKDFESLNRPVATIDFQIVADDGALTGSPSDNSKVLGRGELRIHAHLTPEPPRVAFAGVLRYETVHEGSTTSTHLFPPTQMAPKNPLGFTPWPTNVFNEFDLLPLWGFLRGNVRTAWDDDPQSIGFDLLNVEESFWEGNDGQWIREGIMTDGDEKRRVVVGNHR
ncbi:MAG: toll/interleukin-1 receptor domain-containing protein, partial [Pseudomonadota bacterium]